MARGGGGQKLGAKIISSNMEGKHATWMQTITSRKVDGADAIEVEVGAEASRLQALRAAYRTNLIHKMRRRFEPHRSDRRAEAHRFNVHFS